MWSKTTQENIEQKEEVTLVHYQPKYYKSRHSDNIAFKSLYIHKGT